MIRIAKSRLARVILLTTLASTAAEGSAPARIQEVSRASDRSMDGLEQLLERFGPRLSGSLALAEASRWARDEFERLGLHARIESYGTLPVGFERGRSRARILGPGPEQALAVTTPAWSAGTLGPVRGPLLRLPDPAAGAGAIAAGALRGAWVLLPDATPGSEVAAFHRSRAGVLAGGALGTLRPERGEVFHARGNPAIDPSNRPSLPDVIVRASDFAVLLARLAEHPQLEIEVDLTSRFTAGPVELANVVAELPGTRWPEQVVLLGAHLDSWDVGTGATDNGVGVAATMEAARLLVAAGVRPRRTIRFVLFTGEEQGLLGSRAYVRAHQASLDRISAVFVLDGGPDPIRGLPAPAALRPDLLRALAAVPPFHPGAPFLVRSVEALALVPDACAALAAGGRRADAGPRGACDSGTSGACGTGARGACDTGARECTGGKSAYGGAGCTGAAAAPGGCMGGSDHVPFLEAGVPAFFWDQQGPSDYASLLHTSRDTREAVDPKSLRHAALVLATAAVGVADLDHLLARVPTSR